jgi:hypothetical protein
MASLDAHAPSAADMLINEKEAGTTSIVAMLRQSRDLRQFTGTSGGPPTAAEIWEGLRFSLTPKKRMIDNYRSYMDALAAGARRPYYAQGPAPPVPSDPLNRPLAGVFTGVRLNWAKRDAHWRIIELRLAARAYQLEHAAPLPSPAALVPAYLPAVPQDPFAPKPLICRRKGAGLLIYSRGPDGVDDGGKDLGARVEAGSNGDIVSVGVRRGSR